MRRLAAAVAVTVAMGFVIAEPAFAKNYNSNRTQQRAWVGGTQNPYDFPNCYMWSPRYRNYVWICGAPYPSGFVHQ